MSEEANGAAGLVAEIERLRTALEKAQSEIAEARDILHAADTETLADAARDIVREEETSNGAYQLLHTRYWKEAQPELDRLRQQIAAAECAYALAASRHAAALAWLERYGALLPAAWRDGLREALHEN